MKKLILAALACIGLSGCTDPDATKYTLDIMGYDKIYITGYEFGRCERHILSTGFRATSRSNERVSGVVCSDMDGNVLVLFD